MMEEELETVPIEELITSVLHLYQEENELIKWSRVEENLEEEGLIADEDPRIQKAVNILSQIRPNECKEDVLLTADEFKQVIANNATLICHGLLRSLVIKEFVEFSCGIKQIYEYFLDFTSGEVVKSGDLYNVTGEEWCVSIVTIDGQKTSFGWKSSFTLDELCGPLIHGLAVDLLGLDIVNNLPQQAPRYPPDSERNSAPQTPGISGACSWYYTDIAMILMCTMIKTVKIEDWSDSLKHDYVLSFIKGLCCGEDLRFSNASYSQAKGYDCKLNSLAHFLKAFTKNAWQIPQVNSGLDLLFQLRSMEVTTDALAMIAAFLANSGSSPFDDNEVLSQEAVDALLSTMYTAGLGKSSAIFAAQCGVPAISTQSGAMMVVYPGLMGVGLYSPKIDCDCSARSLHFITEITKTHSLHPYCKLDKQVNLPRGLKSLKKTVEFATDPQWSLYWSVAHGDLDSIRRYVKEGLDVSNYKDSMGITLLHIAAAHGHTDMVKYLYCRSPELLFATDKWSRKASNYAEKAGHGDVLESLNILERETRLSLFASVVKETNL